MEQKSEKEKVEKMLETLNQLQKDMRDIDSNTRERITRKIIESRFCPLLTSIDFLCEALENTIDEM